MVHGTQMHRTEHSRRLPLKVCCNSPDLQVVRACTDSAVTPACRCPFVLKPASRTPIGALIIAEILCKAPHLPKGAFSVLPCSREGADLFTTDPRFKLLTFTGSPSVVSSLSDCLGTLLWCSPYICSIVACTPILSLVHQMAAEQETFACLGHNRALDRLSANVMSSSKSHSPWCLTLRLRSPM